MADPSFDALKRFFETAPAAKKAIRPLAHGARVNLVLDSGPANFAVGPSGPAVTPGTAPAPDFTLTLPHGAVERLTGLQSDDVGEFGIAFFQLVLERDPALKVRVKIDAGTGQLVSHGYLGVLAVGGMKVGWWLLKNGVKNPKAAIDRLRGGT